MTASRSVVVWICGVTAAVASVASAQESSGAGSVPRVVASAERVRVLGTSGVRLAILDKTIAIDLEDVPLGPALRSIAHQAGLTLLYREDQVAHAHPVSLHATSMTVEAALLVALHETGLDAALWPTGDLVLVRHGRQPEAQIQGTGTVGGRVTDATTGQSLPQATITITGTALGGTTRQDGTYRLHGAVPGTYRVTARRLGYSVGTRVVTVTTDTGVVTADFALTPSAAVLEQVVTTVTGDEKRYQVGNLIETLHADSVVHTAPVTNLGDVVNARVPGVEVFNPGGVTGASPSINIRGQNSLSLPNQPLLVVDGVRVANSAATETYGDVSSPSTSIGYTGNGGALPVFGSFFGGRFDDLNPEDIETIEVVKGPSAATLYGTDAANGVILVTTKRGVAGAPKWDLSVEQGLLTMDKDRFVAGWHAWGHATGGTPTPEQCTLLMKAAGSCVIDSVTHFTPLQDPATTPVATSDRERYAAQVSGGVQQTRYFVSGTYEGETAPVKLPAPDRALLLNQLGSLGLEPDNVRPNALTKGSGRANLSTPLGQAVDLSISSSLLTQDGRIPNSLSWYVGQETPGYRDANDGWGFGIRPASMFALRNREEVTHTTGSGSATWRPATWLQGRMTAGIDYSSDYLDFLIRPGNLLLPAGQRSNGRVNVALYSVDLGASASTDIGRAVTSKTSIGAQYNHRSELDNVGIATDLAPGVAALSGGAVQTTTEANVETIVSGGYVEQELGFRDRFFVTGAMRVDGGSAFGAAFKTQVYPKFSASWLVSREAWIPTIPGVSSLRLRAAYGSSGVQPGATAALPKVTLSPATTVSGTATGGVLGALGDPKLKPETQTEFEGGADLEALDARVQVGFTYYDKKSRDALVTLPLESQLGIGTTEILAVANATQETNIGSVRNRGYEISASADILRSRPINWSIGVNGSNNQNRLVSLAPGISSVNFGGSPVGSPLFGIYDTPYTFKDLNGDGVIEPNEITYAPGPVFLGSSFPPGQATFSSTVGVWRDLVQVRVQVDRRSGVKLQDFIRNLQPYFANAQGQNDPHASFFDQAAVQAFLTRFSSAGFEEDGSFTRLREVSITFNAPPGVLGALRGRSASLTFAGRNLALWTHYRGADPEVNAAPTGSYGGSGGQAYYDYGAAPASHYWIVRARVGL